MELEPADRDELRIYEVARLRLARMSVAGGNALAGPVAEACKVAANTLDVQRVGVWLFVEGRTALRCFHIFERSNTARSEGAVLRKRDIPTYFQALEERCYIRAEQARTDAVTRELREGYLEPLGITSMLDAPIYFAGQVRGVVCHEHVGKPRGWSNEDCDFAGSVADRLALLGEEAARRDAEHRVLALGEQALDTESMKAVAQLAAGAAHDVRSMVSVVRWAGETIANASPSNGVVTENVDRIMHVTESIMTLARNLETLGREGSHAPQIVSPVCELERLKPLIHAAAGDNYEIVVQEKGQPGLLLIDPSQLERLVLNLVINARDAMPAGGPIVIEVGETQVEDGEYGPGVFTVLAVTDAGVGMSPDVRKRVFEPFFTTKSRDSGTGLGLAVVTAIAESYGGFVHVESEPARGTTFRVYLPRMSACPTAHSGA